MDDELEEPSATGENSVPGKRNVSIHVRHLSLQTNHVHPNSQTLHHHQDLRPSLPPHGGLSLPLPHHNQDPRTTLFPPHGVPSLPPPPVVHPNNAPGHYPQDVQAFIPHPAVPPGPFLGQYPGILRPSPLGINPYHFYPVPYPAFGSQGHWAGIPNQSIQMGIPQHFPPSIPYPAGFYPNGYPPQLHPRPDLPRLDSQPSLLAPDHGNNSFRQPAVPPQGSSTPILPNNPYVTPQNKPRRRSSKSGLNSTPSSTPLGPPGVTPLHFKKPLAVNTSVYSPLAASFHNMSTVSPSSSSSPTSPQTASPALSSSPLSSDEDLSLAKPSHRKRPLNFHTSPIQSSSKAQSDPFIMPDGKRYRTNQLSNKKESFFAPFRLGRNSPSPPPRNKSSSSKLPSNPIPSLNLSSEDSSGYISNNGSILNRPDYSSSSARSFASAETRAAGSLSSTMPLSSSVASSPRLRTGREDTFESLTEALTSGPLYSIPSSSGSGTERMDLTSRKSSSVTRSSEIKDAEGKTKKKRSDAFNTSISSPDYTRDTMQQAPKGSDNSHSFNASEGANGRYDLNIFNLDASVNATRKKANPAGGIPYAHASAAGKPVSEVVFDFKSLTSPSVFLPTASTPKLAPKRYTLRELGFANDGSRSTGERSTQNVEEKINEELGLAVYEAFPWIDRTVPFYGPEEYRAHLEALGVNHMTQPGYLHTAMPLRPQGKIGYALRPEYLNPNEIAFVVSKSKAYHNPRPVDPKKPDEEVDRCQICQGILTNKELIVMNTFIMRPQDKLTVKRLYYHVRTMSCYAHWEDESAFNTGINVFRKSHENSVDNFWKVFFRQP